MVLRFFAGHTLLVNKNQPFIRKNEHIPDQLIGPLDFFLRGKNLCVFPLNIRQRNLRGITQQPVEHRHCPAPFLYWIWQKNLRHILILLAHGIRYAQALHFFSCIFSRYWLN
ncbi:hypothetical protein D3C73_1022260 [compost metagenome]